MLLVIFLPVCLPVSIFGRSYRGPSPTTIRLHRSPAKLAPLTSIHNSDKCIATIKDVILDITLQKCSDLALAGRRGRGGGGGRVPIVKIGPNHHTTVAFVVETPSHCPCCTCPTHVPHVSPLQPLLSLVVVLAVPLNILLLAVAIGSFRSAPPPLFLGLLESPLFLGIRCTLRPRLSSAIGSLAPTTCGKSRHIM